MKTKNHNELLKSNIYKNYIFVALLNFNLTRGVWMLYLAYRGLSLFQIGLMEAVFHITSFTMEIPTGIVADLLGRKASRVIGRIVAIISTIMMIYSNGVLGFAISFVFSALSYNLDSGAGEALVYDSMKEIGQEKGFMKVQGRTEVVYQCVSALALPIGGYLATLDYGHVYKLSLVVGVVAFLSTLPFTEPTIGKVEKKENALKTFTHQFTDSIRIIREDSRLAFFIIMSESFGALATTTFFYIQNLLKIDGRSEFRIGIVLAVGALLSAVGASQAHRIERRFGYKKTLIFLLGMGGVFLWMMSTKTLSEIGVTGLGVVEAIEFVIMCDYINKLIPSEKRATILSMQSMVFSFFMILMFPLVGLVGDWFSLRISFMVLGAIGTGLILFMISRIQKDTSDDSKSESRA